MGSSKKTTVGYWYPLAIRFGLGGAIDAFLQLRGGDRAAWQGELTSPGAINVDALELWGGEDGEGGMQGAVDIDFGTADQQPNAYCAGMFGPDSGYRGMSTVTWKGGKYGAFNPYPKPAAFLVRSILSGWADGDAWYPEKASINFGGTSGNPNYLYLALDVSGSMAGTRMDTLKTAMATVLDDLESWSSTAAAGLTICIVAFSTGSSITRSSGSAGAFDDLRGFIGGLVASGGTDAAVAYGQAHSFFSASTPANNVLVCVSDGAMSNVDSTVTTMADMLDTANDPYSIASGTAVRMYGVGIESAGSLANFDNVGEVPVIDSTSADELATLILSALYAGTAQIIGMNPAHVLYRRMRAKGEPLASINDASFRAAADVFYNEGFGICTTYDHTSEDHDDFVSRICNVAGANLSRSRVNGQWYLDPVRGDYDIDTLPVLTDADIIEWGEEPSVLDDAVNQVSVEWLDPATKETRTTSPVQSLGAIQSAGTVNADTNKYPEIPSESLALRKAASDLRSSSTPLRRFPLTCNRTPYAWRKGSRFHMQCPLRGIEDMVCMVGEIDVGTLRSGSIAMTAVQDVFGMPETTYVAGEPGVDTSPDTTPVASPAQRLMETSYRDLAQVLSAADLGALAPEAGYIALMAQRPGNALNYTLATAAGVGEDYQEWGIADWCPTAVVQDAAAQELGPTDVVLIDGDELSWVEVGTAALWDDEIVRVDAIDTVTGACTLGRGCVDTVPAEHAAGSRIWFYDSYVAADEREYVAGETAHAKALTRTSSAVLSLAAAPTSDVTLSARAVRPYPPGLLQIGGGPAPSDVSASFVVTWAHRDRPAQADKLVDTIMASIGPEKSVRYALRLLGSAGEVLVEKSDIAGATATVSLMVSGEVTLQLYSISDSGESWQRHELTFPYTPAAGATENTIVADTYNPEDDITIVDGGEIT